MHRKWWTLLIVCVATFMLLLDITIVNVALPSIQRSLHASFSDLQWVVDAYALTLAALLLTAGSLADLFGHKRLFVLGLGLFTAASLVCGLAGRPLVLNLARGAQGIGGAVMFATSLALLAHEFHGRERGTAYGAWGATIAGAAAVGPLVGGALTEGLGWEYIFFLNIPIGLVGMALSVVRLGESRDPEATRIDWAGLVTFSAALFLLVLALIRGNDQGWGSPPIVAELVCAGVLLVAFVIAETVQRRPMLPLSLFRNPTFTGASLVALSLAGSAFAMFLYETLYIQNILGLSPLATGVRFLPVTVLAFVVAPISGRASHRFPPRALFTIGMLLVAGGFLWMHGVDIHSTWTALLGGFILLGLGLGVINPTLAQAAVGVVHPARSGMASGINNTFRQVGIATGIAGLGAVFQHRAQTRALDLLASAHAGATPDLAHRLVTGSPGPAIRAAPPPMRPELALAAKQGFITGFNDILLIAAGTALAGAVLGLLLVRRSDYVETAPQPAAAPA